MRINPINTNTKINFKGALNNKMVLGALEKISDHATTFTALVTLASSLALRPVSIALAPDTEKENKQYAISNSISSGLIKFLMVEAVALPIEGAVKKINENPSKYLKQKTIETLREGAQLDKSKSFNFIGQTLKLFSNFITAVPKSMLTIALIPLIMDKLFKSKNINKKEKEQIAFKGNIQEGIAKVLGGVYDNSKVQDLAKKNVSKAGDIAKNMIIATDVLLASSFAFNTTRNKKIEEKRKKALIYNNLISTGASILGGCALDNFVKRQTNNLVEKFKEANKNNPKLHKYLEGINIARPAIVFAFVYYGILPFFSTYLSEKADKLTSKGQKEQ